jgi:hypothetical protein
VTGGGKTAVLYIDRGDVLYIDIDRCYMQYNARQTPPSGSNQQRHTTGSALQYKAAARSQELPNAQGATQNNPRALRAPCVG